MNTNRERCMYVASATCPLTRGQVPSRKGQAAPQPYLAKLLKAADCGLMHNGTRLVFSCSLMNLCISSATLYSNRYCLYSVNCNHQGVGSYILAESTKV